MTKAMGGKKEDLGFAITSRRSERYAKVVLADLNLVNDIVLLLDEIA